MVVFVDAVEEGEVARRDVVGEHEGDVAGRVGPEREHHHVEHEADEFVGIDRGAAGVAALSPPLSRLVKSMAGGAAWRAAGSGVGPGRRPPAVGFGRAEKPMPALDAADGIQVLVELVLIVAAQLPAQVAGVVQGGVEQASIVRARRACGSGRPSASRGPNMRSKAARGSMMRGIGRSGRIQEMYEPYMPRVIDGRDRGR